MQESISASRRHHRPLPRRHRQRKGKRLKSRRAIHDLVERFRPNRPNEELRRENNSSELSDCRAYEMVSPPEKSVTATAKLRDDGRDGQLVLHDEQRRVRGTKRRPAPVSYLLELRLTGGEPKTSPEDRRLVRARASARALAGSDPDFGKFLFTNEGVELGPEHRSATASSLRHGRRLIAPSPPPAHECSQPPGIRGGSADFSRIVDRTKKGMTPEYTGEHPSLYLSERGVSKLVSVLPNGTPAEGVISSGPMVAPPVA